jgi:DNA-binding CsgD family transcriptional regulator
MKHGVGSYLFVFGLTAALCSVGSAGGLAQTPPDKYREDSLRNLAGSQTGRELLRTCVLLGRIACLKGDETSLAEGLSWLNRAVEISRELNEERGLMVAWLNLGILLDIRGTASAEAEGYLRRSLQVAQKLNLPANRSLVYHTLGSVYFKRREFRRAIALNDSAYSLIYPEEDGIIVGPQILSNQAGCYAALGKADSAVLYYRRAFEACNHPDNRQLQIQILIPWIRLLNEQKRFAEALTRLQRLDEVMDTTLTIHHFGYHNQKALTLAGLGRFAEAHLAWKEADRIRAKLSTEESEKQINEFQVKYRTLEQEARNKELIQRNQIQQLWLGLAGAGLVALACVLGLGAWAFRQRQQAARRQHQLLETENQLIKARNEEEAARVEQLDLQVRLLESEREKAAAEREKEEAQLALQLAQAEARRREAEREATAASYRLVERTTFLKDLLNRTENILQHVVGTDLFVAVRQLSLYLKQNLDDERKNWEMLLVNFDKTHHRLTDRLKAHPAQLTAAEIRLAVLIYLGHSNVQLADLQNVSLDAVKKAKYRLKKRLDLPEDDTLEHYLQELQASELAA